MRNLKRALSLALACVMLLGMMVMGTSASTFNDADSIVNKEAVEIAAGLGLFAGTDGNFMPTGTVTRAQMATIIVKMLYGSDFNADSYKGLNTFSDTAAFEGGWAEGYINACVAAKVVAGYGDGTFKPGNPVTTAEAITMIINALKVDAGEGTWPMTVMAKAEEMKLFGELSPKPQTNVALTRDALAVICVEALNYSPAGTKGYVVEGIKDTVFTDYLEAWIAAGQNTNKISTAAQDTLATTTFDMKTVEGFVMSNQATGYDYTVLNNGMKFAVETGLDMIGHYVTVYYAEAYTSEQEPGVAYAVVDESSTIVVAEDIEADRTEFRAAFGAKPVFGDGYEFDGNYVDGDLEEALVVSGFNASAFNAPAGTYVVYEGEIVAYVAPAAAYAAKVTSIDTTVGSESISLSDGSDLSNSEDDDVVVEYDGIAKGDYVTYVVAQGQVVLTKAEMITGVISSIATKDEKTYVTVDGTAYPMFGGNNGTGLTTSFGSTFNFDGDFDVYLSADGKFLGCTAAAGTVDVSNVVYLLGAFAGQETKDAYGKATKYIYAQGVDAEGEEALIQIGAVIGGDEYGVTADEDINAITEGFYVVKNGTTKDEKKYEIQILDKCDAGYNEDTNPFFIGSNRWATTSDTTISISSGVVYAGMHVCTSSCPAGNGTGKAGHSSNHLTAYYSAASKFLVVDGTLQEELDTAVIAKANISYTIPRGDEQKIPFLFTKDAGGNTIVVMALIKADPANLNGASTDPIYVTAEQTSAIGKDANGYLFEVYNANKGTLMNLTMEASSISAGLWDYSVDEETGLTTIGSAVETNVDDCLYNLDMTFVSLYTSGSTRRINFAGANSSNSDTVGSTKIIDLRSKEQMLADGVTEITSVDRIAALADMGKLVVCDVIGSSSSAIGAMYVKKVVTAPTEPELIYMPRAATTPNATYEAYSLSGEFKEVFVSEVCDHAGFVYYVYDGSAYIVTEVEDDENFYSMELVSALADGVLSGGRLSNVDITNAGFVDFSGYDIEDAADLQAKFDAGYSLYVGAYVNDEGDADSIFVVSALPYGNGAILYREDGNVKGNQSYTLYTMNGEAVTIKAPAGATHYGGKFYKVTVTNGSVSSWSAMSCWNRYSGSTAVSASAPCGFMYHNNWASYDAETRTLTTSEDYASVTHVSGQPAYCNMGCGHSGSTVDFEHDNFKLADDVVVVDTRDGKVYTGAAADTFLSGLNTKIILDAAFAGDGEEATFVAVGAYDTEKAAAYYGE